MIIDTLSNASPWGLFIFFVLLFGVLIYYALLRDKEKEAAKGHSTGVQETKNTRRKVVGITTIVFVAFMAAGLMYLDIPLGFWLPRKHVSHAQHSGINIFYLLFFSYLGLTVVHTIVNHFAKEKTTMVFITTVAMLFVLSVGGVYYFTTPEDRNTAVLRVQYALDKRGKPKTSPKKPAASLSEEKSACLRTGTLRLESGAVYSGELVNGKPHGEGVLASPKGFRYKGAFRNGVPDGKGKISMQDGSWEAEGVFYQTEPVGVCTLYWHLPAGERRYVGEVEKLEPHGKGTMYETDGAIYEGTFCHGQKHGSGEYSYTDGSTFRGIWENNKLIHKQQ
ncbi:MAG: MORN repeat-containing protein [Paludibacteraceae bacterium]